MEVAAEGSGEAQGLHWGQIQMQTHPTLIPAGSSPPRLAVGGNNPRLRVDPPSTPPGSSKATALHHVTVAKLHAGGCASRPILCALVRCRQELSPDQGAGHPLKAQVDLDIYLPPLHKTQPKADGTTARERRVKTPLSPKSGAQGGTCS